MDLELINKKIFANVKDDDTRLVILAIAEEAYNKGFNDGFKKGSKSVLDVSIESQKLLGMTQKKDKADPKSYI
jgi:hypothetical protein